ncbi:hypothetical protein C2G38_2050343 [Gigaspora rosea]|uniref:Uncharacterized protein n=1 Tax=Gigaspora rosea TaxID=44941 RepID=A0A397U4U5_9GLOM|nr:hypothetical protein C2G38_2050343 [Gigaspora rosea]
MPLCLPPNFAAIGFAAVKFFAVKFCYHQDSLLLSLATIRFRCDSTFVLNVDALTKVLYHQQCREHAAIELDSEKFEYMLGNANPQLEGFFSSMMNAIIPKKHLAYSINEAKKSIVSLCYMIADLRNKFVNRHKLEVGLYLMASGATWEAVDIMASLGYSACAKTVEEFRKKIQIEYVIKIEQHFITNVC